MAAAILTCGVPFSAPTVRCNNLHFRSKNRCFSLTFLLLNFLSVLMGQVMTRMRLTATGEAGWYRPSLKTYKCVISLVLSYIALMVVLIVLQEYLLDYAPAKVRQSFRDILPVIEMVATVLFSFWAFYSLCMTRENVRVRHSIRQRPCFCGCEDLCCSVCCTCCTVAQLARHTGNYETVPASCCGESGHASKGPLFV